MNKFLSTLVLSVICLSAGAQSKALDSFYDKYKDKKDVTHVSLSGSIFKLASWISDFSDEDDDELRAVGELSEGIESMEILNIDDFDDYFDKEEIEELVDNMKEEGYEVIMTVREDRKLIRILAENIDKKMLDNVTIIIRDAWDFSAITIRGSIHVEDLEEVMDR